MTPQEHIERAEHLLEVIARPGARMHAAQEQSIATASLAHSNVAIAKLMAKSLAKKI